VLFGAVGDWKYDKLERPLRPEQAILGLRKHLGLFANFRPAICYEQLTHASSLKPELVAGLDILIIRELTGDIYFGQPRGRRTATDGHFPGARKPSTPCATAARRSSASPTWPSRPRASAARR
jgi:3-isopropylmalate dehydrogenase